MSVVGSSGPVHTRERRAVSQVERSQTSASTRKYDSSFPYIESYPVTGGSDWIDIATGNILVGPIATCGGNCLFGLTVAGKLSVVQPTPTLGGQPTPTATAIPATSTPPTPVPVTGRGGLAFLIGLLALSGALIL